MNTKKYSEEERKARDRASKLRWWHKNKQKKLHKVEGQRPSETLRVPEQIVDEEINQLQAQHTLQNALE